MNEIYTCVVQNRHTGEFHGLKMVCTTDSLGNDHWRQDFYTSAYIDPESAKAHIDMLYPNQPLAIL